MKMDDRRIDSKCEVFSCNVYDFSRLIICFLCICTCGPQSQAGFEGMEGCKYELVTVKSVWECLK